MDAKASQRSYVTALAMASLMGTGCGGMVATIRHRLSSVRTRDSSARGHGVQ